MVCKWQVEKDEWCQKILAKHWPDVPRFGDIHNVGKHNLEPVDVICGGFPCQPFSDAGKQLGSADDRFLWPEMLRIVQELKPRWVIGENVSGFIGLYLDQAITDLEAQGYEAWAVVFPACGFNAPHIRKRVFIMAYTPGGYGGCFKRTHSSSESLYTTKWQKGPFETNRSGKVMAYPPQQSQREPADKTNSLTIGGEARNESGNGGQSVAFGEGHRFQGDRPIWEQVTSSRHQETESKRGSDRTGNHWTIEPAVGRVADGIPAELDFIRGLENEKSNRQESNSKIDSLIGATLLAMWQYRELAKTSPDLYAKQLCDSVPEMPRGNSYSRWFMGSRFAQDQGLRDLWQAFYTAPLEEAQDLQRKLLERIGSAEREEKMAFSRERLNRLRGLGNAVVPQIAQHIGEMIIRVDEAA